MGFLGKTRKALIELPERVGVRIGNRPTMQIPRIEVTSPHVIDEIEKPKVTVKNDCQPLR